MTNTAAPAGAPVLPPVPRRRGALVARWIGIASMLGGAVMIVMGGVVWGVVSSQLKAQHITVAEDAAFLAGASVEGPFTALAEADIIEKHSLTSSGGKTYAELDKSDPKRAVVMNASFLRASLFTSVVSFGVSAFAMGAGLVIGLLGWAVAWGASRR